MLRKVSVSLFIVGLIFLAGFSSLPIKVQAVSEPLTTTTSTRTLAPIIKYPSQLVQPRIQPIYRFGLDGKVYAGNNIGDNISLAPSITGYTNPRLDFNSTDFRYSKTFNGCTITISYKYIGLNLKQTITGSNCPIGSIKFNIANLKGFTATSDNCSINYKSISYSWCGDVLNGITISYSSGVITITTTSNNWSIDPTVVQSGVDGNCGSAGSSCAGNSHTYTSGNFIILSIEWNVASGTCQDISTITDTKGFTYTSAIDNVFSQNSLCAGAAIWYASITSSGANTITITFTSTVASTIWAFYEVSGILTTPIPNTGSTTNARCTSITGTSSVSFTNSAFLVGQVGCNTGAIDSYTAGTGFTAITMGSNGASEYSTTVNSPSTFPITVTRAGGDNAGAALMVSAAFEPLPPILLHLSVISPPSTAGQIIFDTGKTVSATTSTSISSSTVLTLTAIQYASYIFFGWSESGLVLLQNTIKPTQTITVNPTATTTQSATIVATFSQPVMTVSYISSSCLAGNVVSGITTTVLNCTNSIATASSASTAGGAPQEVIPVETPNYTTPIFIGIAVLFLMVVLVIATRRKR